MTTFKVLSYSNPYTKTHRNRHVDIKTLLPSGSNRKTGSQFYIDGKKYRLLKTLHSRGSERAIFKVKEISSQIIPSKTTPQVLKVDFTGIDSQYEVSAYLELRPFSSEEKARSLLFPSKICQNGELLFPWYPIILSDIHTHRFHNTFRQQLKDVALQIIQGVHFLHDHNIVHRDLKPWNIVLNLQPDHTFDVKIIDLGSATHEGTYGDQVVGSNYFTAPECGSVYFSSKSMDIWSLGVLFFYINKGRYTIINLKSLKRGIPISEATIKCLRGSPLDRPTIKELSQIMRMCSSSTKPFLTDDKNNQPKQSSTTLHLPRISTPTKKHIPFSSTKNSALVLPKI